MIVNRNPAYFFAIAREQNITRAAKKLYITQSSLSQHIAKLEQELGVTLFDRSQSPLVLTEAGQIYLHYLESQSFLQEKLLADLNNDRMQSIDMGVGSWRGSILLPELIPGFLIDHPNVRVELHEFPVSELVPLVQDGKVDFALMNTASPDVPNGLVSETIVNEHIFLAMPRENALAQEFAATVAEGGQIDLRRLTEERYIALDSGQTVGRHVENFFQKHKLMFPRRLVTTNNQTALQLAARGIGFCFMVEQGLSVAQNRTDFQVFDLHDPELLLPLSLLYKVNAYQSPLCLELLDRLRRYYKTMVEQNEALLQ